MTIAFDNYRDLFASPESINSESHILVKYRIKSIGQIPLERIAIQCALDGSTVAWDHLPHHNNEWISSYTAKVRSLSQIDDRNAVIEIAFPIVNMRPEIGGIPLLLAIISGSIIRERSLESIRIIDIELPISFVSKFPGPRFGINGIRKRLHIEDRPILIARIHDVGLSPKELSDICSEVAYGGADIIMSSPLLVDTDYSPLFKRVESVVKSMQVVYNNTGKETLYLPNLTVGASNIHKLAESVIALGASGFEIDMLCSGYSAVQWVREQLDCIISFYPLTHAVLTRGTTGIDLPVILKLGRLSGADMVCISSVVGRFELASMSDIFQQRSALLGKWQSLLPSLPIVIGGQHAGTVKKTMELMGNNIGISAGTGILGHPAGSNAGAKSMRQAIDIAANKYYNEYDVTNKEYNDAIRKWGKE